MDGVGGNVESGDYEGRLRQRVTGGEPGDDAVTFETNSFLCRTVVRIGETLEQRNERLQKSWRMDRTIWVRNTDGARIRRSSRPMCFRVTTNGAILDHHFNRTTVSHVKREEVLEEAKRNFETTKHRAMGRFRNQLQIKTKGFGIAQTELDGSTNSSGNVEVIEIRFPTTARMMTGVNRRGRSGSSSGSRGRARRRRVISLDKFKMFKEGERQTKRRRGDDGAEAQGNNSKEVEEKKFKQSLLECYICTDMLFNAWIEVPFLRSSGWQRRNQKYVNVSSVRMTRKMASGVDTLKSVIVSTVVEEESRRVRNICARREKVVHCEDGSDTATVLQDDTVFSCSCHVQWEEHGIVDSKCWHIDILRKDEQYVNRIEMMLDCGFDETHSLYFGEVLKLEERERDGRINVDLVEGMQRGIDPTELRRNGGMCAIQLDDMSKEDLLRKGSRIAKTWSAWCVLDFMDKTIVTVTWRRMSRSGGGTRMSCMTCRGEERRKCRHELACEREVEVRRGEEDGNGEETGGEVSDDSNDLEEDLDVDMGGGESARTEVETPQYVYTGKAENNGMRTTYYVDDVRRSFMFCDVQLKLADKLTDIVEKELAGDGCFVFGDPDGTQCTGKIRQVDGSLLQCSVRRKASPADIPRPVTLFTLNHSDISIVLLDWTCPSCEFMNTYRGVHHGIYPARYGTAYSMELMYWWLHEMCSHTNSFRAVYESSRKLQYSASYRRKFDTGRMNILRGRRRPNRRYANEAIRHFIASIDVDSLAASRQVYSCSVCEEELLESDMKQLGISAEQGVGQKRLRGVVVDAKVVALLKDSKPATDVHDVLKGPGGIPTRVVVNRDTQNAMRSFVKLVRSCISMACKHGGSFAEGVTAENYIIQGGNLYIRLLGMMKHGSTKGQCDRAKVLHYINVIRWYIDRTVCMCEGETRIVNRSHATCAEGRTKMRSSGGADICGTVLHFLFDNAHHGDIAGSPRGEQSIDVESCWVVLKGTNYGMIEEIIDSTMELITFCLTEPLSLGFFPYHTSTETASQASSRTDRTEVNSTTGHVPSESGEQGNDRSGVDVVGNENDVPPQGAAVLAPDARQPLNVSGEDRSSEGINDGLGQSVPRDEVQTALQTGGSSATNDELNDGSARVMEAPLVTPTTEMSEESRPANSSASVHEVGTEGTNQGRAGNDGNTGRSTEDIRGLVPTLATESIQLHREVAKCLRALDCCTHGGRDRYVWVCVPCLKALSDLSDSVLLQNPVVGRYVRDVLRCGERNSACTRRISAIAARLLERRVADFEKYLETLSMKMDPTCMDYWNKYGTVLPDPLEDGNAVNPEGAINSFYVFPGRKRVINSIDFEKVDKQECSKVYFKGDSTVPSFLTVQCCCAHPKLLGFVVLKEFESISAALSSVLTHFAIPPRRVWYDNACNTYDSAMIRVPWMLRWTMLIVDRFHYSGHNCCNIFNGNVHRMLDLDRSVAAEVINSIIDKGTSHIAYLKGCNVIPFMKILFAHMNATAQVRDRLGRDDLEDEDILHRFAEQYDCTCTLCNGDLLAATHTSGESNNCMDGVTIFTKDNVPMELQMEALVQDEEDIISSEGEQAVERGL